MANKKTKLEKQIEYSLQFVPHLKGKKAALLRHIKFVEHTFGELARKVHKQVFGKKPKR